MQTLLSIGKSFLFGKLLGGFIITNLQQLYADREKLKAQKVTGYAGAMQRHQKVSKLQKEIDYYELGDAISRTRIQDEMVEIDFIQEEINRLKAVVAEKRSILMGNVFGEHTSI